MNCNHCSNPATIFLTRVEGDSLKKIALCQSCAEDPDLIAEQGLEQLLGLPSPPAPVTQTVSNDLSCTCGFTISDLSRTGRLGCAMCYDTFGSVISDRIESIHRGTTHTGKAIEIELSDEMLQRKHDRLLEALEAAIESENFEQAVQLRDEIEAIKNQLTC